MTNSGEDMQKSEELKVYRPESVRQAESEYCDARGNAQFHSVNGGFDDVRSSLS